MVDGSIAEFAMMHIALLGAGRAGRANTIVSTTIVGSPRSTPGCGHTGVAPESTQ
jgi:hypothetical protein